MSTQHRPFWAPRRAIIALLVAAVLEGLRQIFAISASTWQTHAAATLLCASVLFLLTSRSRSRTQNPEAFSENIIESLPGIACIIGDGGRLKRWNSSLEQALGYTAEELKQITAFDMIAKEQQKAVQDLITTARRLGMAKGESVLVAKDGTRIPCLLAGTRIVLPDGPHVLGIAIDLTNLRQAEDELRKIAAIVEFSQDAILAKTTDGVITSWNRAAEKMYGYTMAEAVGRDLSFLLPSHRRSEMAGLLESIRRAQPIESFETQRVTKEGVVLDVSVSVSPIKDATGRVTGASTIARDITLRKRAEKQLKLQSRALEAAANAIVITDFGGTVQWVNPAFTTMTGYSAEEVLGKNPRLLKSGEQSEAFYADIWSTVSAGKVWRGELVNRRKDGTTYPEEMTITPVAHGNGDNAETQFIAIKQDITERKRTEKQLWLAQFSLEHASDNIFWSNSQGRFVYVNEAACRALGYSREELLSLSIADLNPSFQTKDDWPAFWQELKRQGSITFESQNTTKQGQVFPTEITANYLEFDGQEYSFAFVRDITDRKLAEEKIHVLAYSDALTELPNRRLLQDRLTQAMASARRQKSKVALLFLDLDRFKNVNDSLGHLVGDLLLQQVAKRLKKLVREYDTVARVGGDEFLIVLSELKDSADAAIAAERIMDAIIGEYSIQGHTLNINCSLGISIFPEDGSDAETLIKNADIAMYSAKDNGRNGFRFSTGDVNAQALVRLNLENNLHLALAKNELFLVYQPQMEIATGKIIGLEALLRWQNPELGLVPPDQFIRIAENCGLIVPIGEWVLKTACVQARKWQQDGLPAVKLAVNVSAVQFRREGFCELVERVLRETGLAPQYLELELTESLVLADAEVTLSVIQELRAMGLTLAIDDFGTGYASFNYLRKFGISKIKIDRSFIRDIAVNPEDAAITTAIIGMAKSLHLKVIAEGVEDEAQMSFLRAHRCDEIQGYYFSRPLAVEQVAEKFRDHGPEPQARAQVSGAQS